MFKIFKCHLKLDNTNKMLDFLMKSGKWNGIKTGNGIRMIIKSKVKPGSVQDESEGIWFQELR